MDNIITTNQTPTITYIPGTSTVIDGAIAAMDISALFSRVISR